MNKIMILAIGLFLGVTSCKNQATDNNNSAEVSQSDETQSQNGLVGQVELNNGEKWPVNEEMKVYVTNGEALVKAYIESGDSDYEKLAEEVAEQNDKLITSCTMTGKSHEELHKWLEPHLKLVNMLEEIPNAEMAQKVIDRLKVSYEIYHSNFE